MSSFHVTYVFSCKYHLSIRPRSPINADSYSSSITFLLETLFCYFSFCGFYSITQHSVYSSFRTISAAFCLLAFIVRLVYKRMAAYDNREILHGPVLPCVLLVGRTLLLQCPSRHGMLIVATCFSGAWVWNVLLLATIYYDEHSQMRLERFAALL
jgi:hypothetical protein